MLYNKLVTENKATVETVEYSVGAVRESNPVEKDFFNKELFRLINTRIRVEYEGEEVFFELDYDALIPLLQVIKMLINLPKEHWQEYVEDMTPLLGAIILLAAEGGDGTGAINLNEQGDKIAIYEVYNCPNEGVHIEFIIKFSRGIDPIPLSFAINSLDELDIFLDSIGREVRNLTKSLNDYHGMTETEARKAHGKAHDLVFGTKRYDELEELLESGMISMEGEQTSAEFDDEVRSDFFNGVLDENGNIIPERFEVFRKKAEEEDNA